MKRLKLATATAAGALMLGMGGAWAAECDGSSSPVGFGQLFFTPDLFVDSSVPQLSASCEITNALDVGEPGRFVVYSVDIRGGGFLDAGSSDVTLQFDGEGQSDTVTFSEGVDGSFPTINRRYAAGLNPADGFDGAYNLSSDGGLNGVIQIDDVNVTAVWTTLDDQEDSLSQIGQQQAGIVTHLDGISTLLTSGNEKIEGEDGWSVFGGVGSMTVGARMRHAMGDGLTLLSGVSFVSFELPGASASGVLGGASLRYVAPDGGEARFFGEGGVQVGGLGYTFTRSYDDSQSPTDYEVGSSGSGLFGAAYAKGGLLWQPTATDEVALAVSIKQSLLGMSTFAEDDPDTNPNFFSADLSGYTTSYTTLKAGADWTTQLSDELDLTLSGALGTTFGNNGVAADVFGVSDITGEAVVGAPGTTLFGEYGVRIGFSPTPDSRIDGFIQGTTGTGIGTHAQIGGAYNMKF